MARNARAFARTNAAEKIAHSIEALAGLSGPVDES
jgi:hypothetical protein